VLVRGVRREKLADVIKATELFGFILRPSCCLFRQRGSNFVPRRADDVQARIGILSFWE
jgi:hypothetical protein